MAVKINLQQIELNDNDYFNHSPHLPWSGRRVISGIGTAAN
jgi:hypothetical protein